MVPFLWVDSDLSLLYFKNQTTRFNPTLKNVMMFSRLNLNYNLIQLIPSPPQPDSEICQKSQQAICNPAKNTVCLKYGPFLCVDSDLRWLLFKSHTTHFDPALENVMKFSTLDLNYSFSQVLKGGGIYKSFWFRGLRQACRYIWQELVI